MTQELEGQDKQENQNEKNVEDKIDEIEKIQPEDSPKNGGGNDIKKEEVTVPVDVAPEEDEVATVSPKRRSPPFWERIFQRAGNRKNATKQDAEAGTELLSKDGKVEIKEEDGKLEKNDSGTDVTVPITDDNEITGEAPNGKVKDKEDKQKNPKAYCKHIVIGLAVIALLLIIICVISVLTSSGSNERGPMGEPLVITDCGPVKGFTEDDIYVFKGIPYALPPTGEHRWKPTRAASDLNDCWTGTYDAFNSSAYCFQKQITGLDLEMSEDCLYLNVITPSLSPPELRPVVVYIPGDYPLQGYTAADIKWRPTASLADEKDVTFVTINYRTGVFGFLTLDLLTNSVRPPTSGNYGLMDMISALKWVQRNIRSFGGDPEKVTVLANGGAATAGLTLLSTKKAEGLFSQMWLTAPSARFSNKTLKEIGEDNAGFLRKLSCDTIECVYNKSSEEIIQATPSFWGSDWSTDLPSADEEQSPVMTVVDGSLLYDKPFSMWKAGVINQVPIVIGSAAQESGSSKILPDLDTWNWTDFSDYVSEKLGTISTNLTVAAIQFYIQNSSTPLQQFHSMVSDIRTICPLEHLTQALGEVLERDIFWYIVDYKPSSPIQLSNDSSAVRLSVHGMDIAAIFGLLDNFITPMAASDDTFQKNMQNLFYSFVYRGTPEIRQEVLMASNFINFIGDQIHSKMTPYENCHLWNNEEVYPTYAKVN